MKLMPKPVKLNIRIQISLPALQKLWFWTDLATGEFSALGEIDEVMNEKTGRLQALRITDLHLVKQACSDSETEMDVGSVVELFNRVQPERLCCWVHSHGHLNVFWSGTDEACIAGMANGNYLLSLVVNKKHSTLLRLDQYYPAHLSVNDLDWEIYFPQDQQLTDSLLAEFKQCVTEQAYTGRTPFSSLQSLQLDAYLQAQRGQIPAESEEDDWLPSDFEEVNYES